VQKLACLLRFSFLLTVVLLTPSVLTAQSVLQFPRVISTGGVLTGIAVGNPTAAGVSVTFTAYQPDGSLLAGGATNPVTVTIPAGGVHTKLSTQIFGEVDFNGWVQATSSATGLTGFFLNLSGSSDLDGAGSTVASSDILVPLAVEDTTVATELTILNVNPEAATATVTLYSQAGAVLLTKEVSLPSRGLLRQTLSDLFGAINFSAASHLRIRSNRPVVIHEVVANFQIPGNAQHRETGALTGRDPSPEKDNILPHFVSGGGWLSLVGLVNGSAITQEVTLTAYKDDGTLWTAGTNPRTVTLEGNGALRTTAGDLFGFSGSGLTSGWIKVTSTLGFVSSYIGYGFETASSLGMVEGTPAGNAARFAVFSHVAEGLGYFTGLAVVNPGNESAEVEFFTLRADGSTVGKSTFTVGPNQHTARLFRELVPGSLQQSEGWGYLRSSKPVIGIVLFGTTNGAALGNVPQQLPAGDFVPPAQTTAAITGNVKAGLLGAANVAIQLTGPVNQQTTTDADGRYAFKLLPAGSYKVTASAGTSLVTPGERLVTLATQNIDGVDFQTTGGVDAPVPSILFVTPSSAFAGSAALSMRVLGTNFTPFSKVHVNGVEQTTSFISSVELQAVVAASSLTQAGAMSVKVVTPQPGGGTSAALAFTVNNPPDHPLIQGFVTVKSAPAGVAIDASRQQALVTNESSDSVLFIDIPTLTVVGEVAVGRSPAEGIDIHPGKDIAIVANVGTNTVSVIDLKTRTATPFTVGKAPIGVAINPKTNRAYVINRDDNNLTAIDLETMATIGTVDTRGTKPSGIAINTISNQIVVSNRDTNTVTHLNAVPTLPVFMGLVEVGKSPRMIAFNEDTNIAVVANAGDNTITIIDMASRQVRSTVGVGSAPTGVAIHRITNNVVVTNSAATGPNQNSQSSVTIMNLDDREDKSELPAGTGAFGVGIDQQRQIAVVANFFSNDAIAFRIPNPQPKINDIEPKTFPVGGGSFTITIKGTGFVPTSVIKLNGENLPTVYISSTELRGTVSGALLDRLLQVSSIETGDGKKAVVFRATAPQFNVSVSNPCPCGEDGGNSPAPGPNNPNTTLQPTNPSPTLLSLSPTEIVVGNPLVLTLNGSGLNATSTINFGGLQLTPDAASVNALVVAIAANQLTAGGDVPVSITNPSPGGGTTQVLTFKVIAQPNPSPAITNVSPGSVNAGSGAHTITVTGTGFIASTTASLGGVVGVVSGNTITFALTAAMTANPGTLSGSVSNPGPGGGSATFALNIVSVVPSISDFNPKTAELGVASVTIDVSGANFRNGSLVTFGTIPLPTTFVSATLLRAQVLEIFLQRAGEFRVGVTNPGPGGGSVEGGLFTVNSLNPAVLLVTPPKTTRRTTPLTVQLTGTGFAANTAVFIGTTRLDAAFASSTSMTATIPASLLNTAGILSITLTNPPPGGGTSLPVVFPVENPTAVVDNVTPNPIAGNLTNVVITVNGRDFVNGAVVQLRGIPLVTTFVSSTQLTALLPAPVFGRHTVTVLNPLPSTVSNEVFLDVTALRPIIDAITPSPTRGGQVIHVTGRNFGPSSLILFLGAIAFPTTYVDPTTLTAVLPITMPVGANPITVLNPPAFEGATALLSDPFTLNILSGTPMILDYSPTSGLEGSTVRIDIVGANFFEGATIQLGGLPLATTRVSLTELVGTGTLGGPGTLMLTVTNSGGAVSNPVPFIITPLFVPPPPPPAPVPTITNIFPSAALVNSETLSIHLNGTNFVSSTTVTFNGVPLTITGRSATSLTATVPASLMTTGGTKPVVVTNPGLGGGSATTNFVVNTVQLSPIVVERIPGGTQLFVLINPPEGTFIWSVNSLDGGSSTFGTISSGGLYTAPATVPSPATFPVCARLSTNATVNACATVTINPTPTAGNDMVVFNDQNPFDSGGMADANNRLMARNLVNFSGVGPRTSGSVVQWDCGRNSQTSSMCTSSTVMKSEIESLGLTVTQVNSSSGSLTSIPANVKALFLWLPTVAFKPVEINTLKNFAENGGRIVFIGEYDGYYGTTGLSVENDLLLKMGAVMQNVGNALDCGYNVLPGARLRTHQVTTGMTQVTVACASVITLGPNDFPLFYDSTNSNVLAGVAKIDVAPLPTVIPLITSIEPTSGPILTPTHVTLTGTGFIKGSTPAFGTSVAAGANVSVSNVVVHNSTTITATLTPAFNATLGSKPVTATTQNGLGGGVNWTVTAGSAPSITSLSRTAALRGSSHTVTVTGTNFTTGATAAITGTEVTLGTPLVHSSTSMTIQFTIASTAPIGVRHLSVTTGGGTSFGSPFAVVESEAFSTFSKQWIGGASGATQEWNNAANWSPVGVPNSSDNVFIPGGLEHTPVLNNHTTIGDLYLAPGAALTINASMELTSTGSVFAGNTIHGSGSLVMTHGLKFLSGTVPNLFVSGNVSSTGNVTVLGTMQVFGTGNYTVGGKILDVQGNFFTTHTASLTMNNPSDLMKVSGTAIFAGGSTNGKLTNGVLELAGNFEHTTTGGSGQSFAATGSHITRFVGSGNQELVTLGAGPGASHFAKVEIANVGSGSVSVNTWPAHALGNLELRTPASRLLGYNSFRANGDLPPLPEGAQIAIADLSIGGNVDALRTIGAGSTLLRMSGTNKTFGGTLNGDLFISGTVSAFSGSTINSLTIVGTGQFDVSGKVIDVADYLVTTNTGKLKMTNPLDRLNVGGDAAFFGGSTAGLLTAGVLSVGGNFTQSGAGGVQDSFSASGGHITRFTGATLQNLNFEWPGSTASHFGHVEISNSGSDGSVFVLSGKVAVAVGSLKLLTPHAKLAGLGTMVAEGDFPSMASGASVTIGNLILGGFVNFVNPVGDGSNTVVTLTAVGGDKTIVGTVNGSVNVMGNYLAVGAVTISKNLMVSGTTGIYVVGNAVTTVGQDFTTIGNGRLAMDDALSILNVAGNIDFSGGATVGFLTGGTIDVKKNFKQTSAGGNSASFSASGTHLTKFSGTSTQNLEFGNPGTSLSHFQNVEITNASALGVNVLTGNHPLALGYLNLTSNGRLTGTGTFTANGTFTAAANAQVSVAHLIVGNSIDASNSGVQMTGKVTAQGGTLKGSFLNDVEIAGEVQLSGNFVVADSIVSVTSGTLDINGKTLLVARLTSGKPADFVTSGTGSLNMNSGGALTANGNVTFSGGSTAGKLNAGVITVGGDFVQSAAGGTTDTFSPGTSNIVKFNGTGTQNVQFSHSGPGASHFNDFEVANSGAGDGVKILSASQELFALRDVRFTGSSPKLTLEKTLTYYGNLFSVEGQTVVNPGNLIDGMPE
jgi:YVTN family beta-propeller protein